MTYSADVLALNPELAAGVYRVKAERMIKVNDGFDSQLERDWAAELTAGNWMFHLHGYTFHLPGGVDYTPDFIAWHRRAPHEVRVYEVKGDLKQKNARDSRTRFKIAAGLYPCFIFIWVTRDRQGEWRETVVKMPG